MRPIALSVLSVSAACLVGTAVAGPQAPSREGTPAAKPLMAEEALKNVQVLRGIPFDEFMGTMGFFSAALSLNCTDCHVKAALDSWDRYADDTPRKQTTRKMILMVRSINQANFGGKREVTCYTCHRSSNRPKVTPSLAEQYGTPPPDDPDELESAEQGIPGAGAPSPDQILDRYIRALGGAQRLAALTSFVAKGTYQGYDTSDSKVSVEVYAKAPGQRTTIAHVPIGDGTTKDSITTYDGRTGWIYTPNTLVPMLTLTGGNLDGAKVDAEFSFPGGIKQALTNWRAGFPETSIDGHDVQVIQGTSAGSLVKLYFDKNSGLLVRQMRYADTVVGLNPTHVDYSDYREVSGVKLPFRWTVTWTDGQSTFEMKELQANVPIDAAKFAKPSANP